jgi:hypothetical protein
MKNCTANRASQKRAITAQTERDSAAPEANSSAFNKVRTPNEMMTRTMKQP